MRFCCPPRETRVIEIWYNIGMKSTNETRKSAARKFREYWTFSTDSEVGGYQKFWIDLLGDVLGVEDATHRISFQTPVPTKDTTKFLDAWIPEPRVLIENKSRGVKLDAPQSGHDGKTPLQQALEYNQARGFSEKARWIVTCNFDEIWVYDMDRPLDDPQKIRLSELPRELARLGFLVDSSVKSVREKEKDISIRAGRIVGELYKALLKRYANPDSPETLKALNRLCVRLVFLFYAEDADIFPKDAFWSLLKDTPVEFLRKRLIDLFLTLDAPPEMRDPYLEPELAAFPYTNGGLFRGVFDAEIPPLDDEIKELLIRSADFDWREISPTIFGALFESTLNPETRRAGGMVYTSVENIHKVIDPLFLDDLTRRVDEALGMPAAPKHGGNGDSETRSFDGEGARAQSQKALRASASQKTPCLSAAGRKKLLALQAEIAALKFLDPACGSGNFLTESYICLRRLENRIIAALQQGQGELDLDSAENPNTQTPQNPNNRIKVSIGQLQGIEINDFAVAVAKTALWIAEAQMRHETAEILHREPDYLPLKDYANIIEGNALRMDWPQADYIMGNPPFRGARNKSDNQAADMEHVFGKDWKGLGNLDYVTACYKKAVDCMGGPRFVAAEDGTKPVPPRCAFVSTNSICQGDGVVTLWKPLVEGYGVEIDFAHRTFSWDNETIASEKAHVHCVIVGFHVECKNGRVEVEKWRNRGQDPQTPRALHLSSSTRLKTIFDNGRVISAEHINAYLMPGPDAWIESRRAALSADLPLVFGSMPNDGGFLSDWSAERRAEVLARHPAAEPLFRRIVGSHESINNVSRWCLWLKDALPAAIRAVPPVMEAVAKVRELRLASKREATRRLAATPALFGEIRQPESGNYLLIPATSSENREYVPMSFMPFGVIANNAALIVPGATLYHFGVLTSSAHMAWMRVVAGRLKSDYRYSAAIVYNNFPWPELGTCGMIGGTGAACGTGGDGTRGTVETGIPPVATPVSPDSPVPPVISKISQTAQTILDARARYPDSSLADLYDPLTMPPDLRAAHEANDRAVLAAYGLAADTPEPEIVAHLFKLYAEMTKKETTR